MRNAESNAFHDTLTSYVLIPNGVCIISSSESKQNHGGDNNRQRLDFPLLLHFQALFLLLLLLCLSDFIFYSHSDNT